MDLPPPGGLSPARPPAPHPRDCSASGLPRTQAGASRPPTGHHPTGHRTGLTRNTPVCAHLGPDGSRLIVASNFGKTHHPAWSTNLLHTPNATITTGSSTIPVTAHLLTDQQKERHRDRILAALPVYDTYVARAQREIRVFHLTPQLQLLNH
ncbi:nitroreductase/quinone reductase family protein [Streptomyces agglomeratus]|uniref:nitroreductase/quinone reductase family protein n=1 Tax=Streptomyces agglomeratus TaxID=285458 RepID=UPI00210DAD5F|nr:nitroreductase/quinone reductase family protein [Streptomyces agglomeratus]